MEKLRKEISELEATAAARQTSEDKILEDLQNKIEEEVQLAMDLDHAKSETRRLAITSTSIKESISEHLALIRSAEDSKAEEDAEAEINSEVERHQELAAARENAVAALAAVSEALNMSDNLEGDNISDNMNSNVDNILGNNHDVANFSRMMNSPDTDSEEESNLDETKKTLDQETTNNDIAFSANGSSISPIKKSLPDHQVENSEISTTDMLRPSPNLKPINNENDGQITDEPEFDMFSASMNNERSISNDERSFDADSMSRDSSFVLPPLGVIANAGGGGGGGGLDEQGRDYNDLIKEIIALKKSACGMGSRTATARSNLSRLIRLIKVYAALLHHTTNQTKDEISITNETDLNLKEETLKLAYSCEFNGGLDMDASWMEYHLKNKNNIIQNESISNDDKMKDSKNDSNITTDTPVWLTKLLEWCHEFNIDSLDEIDGKKSVRDFYTGTELTDREAFIIAETNALLTLARRSGCFTSLLGGSLYNQYNDENEDDDKGNHSNDDEIDDENERKFRRMQEEDLEDEVSVGGILICHAYEWQSWGLFNKGGRWSGLREDLPSPLCNLLPPLTSLENTVVSTAIENAGSRRRSSNSFFALRGLTELFTDVEANTAVACNPRHQGGKDDPAPVGAGGKHWKWLDVWKIDKFVSSSSSSASSLKKDNFEKQLTNPLAPHYLTDEEGWQYAIESKDGFTELCEWKGRTTCGVDEGIAGRPARQLRRRRWSRACQLSSLKSGNPWPLLYKSFESNSKTWMLNYAKTVIRNEEQKEAEEEGGSTVGDDGHEVNEKDKEEEEEEDDDDDVEAELKRIEVEGNDQLNEDEMKNEGPTLPHSIIGEWTRILKLQYKLSKFSFLVHKYNHALNIAQSLELELEVEQVAKKRSKLLYQELCNEKHTNELLLKKLMKTLERAKHDERNEKKLRDALCEQEKPKTPPPSK